MVRAPMTFLPARWLWSYQEDPSAAAKDIAIGLSAGLVFWPLVLGHAALASVPPAVAVATATIPPLIYSLFGSLPLLSLQSGSVAALCVKEIIEETPNLGLSHAEVAMLTAGLVGLVQLFMGLMDFGAVAELFSQPLLRGRLGAATVLILTSQAKVVMGVALPPGESMPLLKLVRTAIALPDASVATLGLSAVLLSMVYVLRYLGRIGAGHPGQTRGEHLWSMYTAVLSTTSNLWVLIVGTIACVAIAGVDVERLESFDPSLTSQAPRLDLALRALSSLAFPACLVGFQIFGGHLVVVNRIRRPTDTFNARRDLLALGMSSLGAAVGGGMPPMANLAVCQTLQRGGKSGLAVLSNAVGHILAFWIVKSIPRLQRVPKCAIAVILVVEFLPSLIGIPKEVRRLLQQARCAGQSWSQLIASDLGIYTAALMSPLIFGIIRGSILAVVLQLLLAVMKFAGAGYTYLGRVMAHPHTYDEIGVEGSLAVPVPKIQIVRVSGARWFGNVALTMHATRRDRKSSMSEVRAVVTDWCMVAFLDDTAIVHYQREWSKPMDVKMIVTNVCARVRQQMESSGLLGIMQLAQQPPEVFLDLHTAVMYAEAYIKTMEENETVIGLREPGSSESLQTRARLGEPATNYVTILPRSG